MLPARGFQKLGETRLDEARVDAVGDEIGMRQQRLQKRDVGLDAFDAELAERAGRLGGGGGEVRRGRMRDDLGDQRIERHARAVARVAERIDPHAGPGGQIERRDPAAGRDRLPSAVIVSRLTRAWMAIAARRVRARRGRDRRGLRRRDADLRRDQIDVEDLLGDGVLDLKPGIGLDEGEPRALARVCRVEQELEGAEAVVWASRAMRIAAATIFSRKRRRQRGARRDLDQLLVAPLDRAFALAEIGQAAVPVAKDLDLDVPGAQDQALGVERAVAERGLASDWQRAKASAISASLEPRACRARRRRLRP